MASTVTLPLYRPRRRSSSHTSLSCRGCHPMCYLVYYTRGVCRACVSHGPHTRSVLVCIAMSHTQCQSVSVGWRAHAMKAREKNRDRMVVPKSAGGYIYFVVCFGMIRWLMWASVFVQGDPPFPRGPYNASPVPCIVAPLHMVRTSLLVVPISLSRYPTAHAVMRGLRGVGVGEMWVGVVWVLMGGDVAVVTRGGVGGVLWVVGLGWTGMNWVGWCWVVWCCAVVDGVGVEWGGAWCVCV